MISLAKGREKSQIMKLHIQTIRCDHMQMLHTVMIRDYDACTAAHCFLLSKSVMQADRLLHVLHGGFKVLQLCRGCACFAVSLQTLSGSVALSELCTHGEPSPLLSSWQCSHLSCFILFMTGGADKSRKNDDRHSFLSEQANFLKVTHGEKTWVQTAALFFRDSRSF